MNHCRILQAISEGAAVVDVDGSYLHRKHQHLTDSGVNVAPLELPPPPITGWVSVTEENVHSLSEDVPQVTAGKPSIFY